MLFALAIPVGAAARTRVYASVRTDRMSGTEPFRVAVELSPGSGEPGIASYVVTVRWDPTVLELVRDPRSYRSTGCCFTDVYSDGWTMIPDGDVTTVNTSMAAQGQLTVISGSAVNRARSNGVLFAVCFRPRVSDVTTTVSVTPGSAMVSPENALSSASGAIHDVEAHSVLTLHLTTQEGRRGDVNGDGQIDSTDYLLLKRHMLGTLRLTDKQLRFADVTGNGVVDSTDYLLLKRHMLGTFRLP